MSWLTTMNMFISYEYDLQTMNMSRNPQVIRTSGLYKREVLTDIRRSMILHLFGINFEDR